MLDVNRDGRPDFVTGGAWYENPSDPRTETFKRHVFDAELTKVHDVRIADIDGDKAPDVVTMSDRNDVRWYKISTNPTANWKATKIGPPVHSGICTGDIDGDGDVDVVRSNIWFENLQAGQQVGFAPHDRTLGRHGHFLAGQRHANADQRSERRRASGRGHRRRREPQRPHRLAGSTS